jgi:TetR/AcrR family transcriptional repressor of nem operon
MSARHGGSPVRTRLLDAAISLTLERGFVGTSVAEVCERADLTKGAFFHYFKDKEAMGKAALQAWIANGTAAYHAAPFWSAPDPLDRLDGYIDLTIALTTAGPCGCLVGILAQELWQVEPNLRAECEAAFSDWADGLAGLIADVKSRHALQATVDPLSLARHFIAVFEGSLVLARAYQRPEIVAEHLGHFKCYVHSLLSNDHTTGNEKETSHATV